MKVGNLLFSMATSDKILDHTAAKRTWPIERDQRNEIGKVFWGKFLDKVCHTLGFHLKDGASLAFSQHPCRRFVFERNLFDIDCGSTALSDVGERVADDSQCTKTKKIHFEKSQFLNMIFIVLCNKRSICHGNRQIFCQWLFCNHNACRVCR